MALSDYTNRAYDYLALRNTTGPGNRRLGLELFNADTSGEICTGVQKLSQRWLLEFMTERGSMPGLPRRGCRFMASARQGLFRLPINVQAAFSAADMQIRRNLRQEENDTWPADERFESAELLNVAVLPGYDVSSQTGSSAVFLTLSVKINSRAGTSREIILPIEIVPRGEQ